MSEELVIPTYTEQLEARIALLEQQIQELECNSSNNAKEELAIAKSKIIAIESTYYEKL